MPSILQQLVYFLATRMTLTRAVNLYWGPVYFSRANAKPGVPMNPLTIANLGAPATASANAVATTQAVASGVATVINGALATAGVAQLDVPRNVVAAWTGAAVCTVRGTDQYGAAMTESSASGTALTGKKAFYTVTSVTFNANVTGATVGTGLVLGLPHAIATNGLFASKMDNATDAGTFVPADTTSPATATTGDNRGTYAPSTAPNATHKYQVVYSIQDVSTAKLAYGVPQFSG